MEKVKETVEKEFDTEYIKLGIPEEEFNIFEQKIKEKEQAGKMIRIYINTVGDFEYNGTKYAATGLAFEIKPIQF